MNINPNLLTGTRYFTGDWVNLDQSNYGLNYDYVPGFAVYCVSNQDWNGVAQYIKVNAGETYTFSMYFRYYGVADDFVADQTRVFIELNDKGMGKERPGVWGADTTMAISNPVTNVNNKFVRIHYTFTVITDGYIKPRVERGPIPNVEIQEYGFKLERGSEMTPYCGTVEEGGGNHRLNDELTDLADNLRSRTGYKEKMTVPEMKDHVNDLSWVNHNLLSGTSDHYQTIYSGDNGFLCKTTATNIMTDTYDSQPGDWYSYSATISNYSSNPICLELWLFKDDSGATHDDANSYPISSHSEIVNPGEYDKDVTAYLQVGTKTNRIRSYIVFPNGKGVKGEQIQVKNERLYKGRQPGVWTPNSVDATTSNDNFTASTLDRSLSMFSYHDLDSARVIGSYVQSHLVNYNSNAQAYRFNLSSNKDWNLQVYPSANCIKNIPAGERVKQEVIISTDATQIKKAGFDFYYDGYSHVYQATVEPISANTYRLTACWEAEETVNLYMYNLYHLDLKGASYLDVSTCNSWIYTGTSVGWELSPVMNLLYDTDNMTDDSLWTNYGTVNTSSIKVQGSNNKIGSYYLSSSSTARAQPIYLQNGVDYTISAYVQTDSDAKIGLLLDNTIPYIPDPVGGSIERAVVKYDYTTDPYFDIKGDPTYHFRRIGYHFNVSKDGYVAPRVTLQGLNNGATSTTIRFGGLQLSTNADVPPYYTSQAGEKLCDMTGVNMLHDTQTLKDWTLDYGGNNRSAGVNIINTNKGYNTIRLTYAWQEAYQDTDLLLRGTRYTYSYNLFTPTRMNWYLRHSTTNTYMGDVTNVDGGEILNDGDTNVLDISVSDTIVDTADSDIPFTFGYGTPNTEWKDNTKSAFLSLPTTYNNGELVMQDTNTSKGMTAILEANKSYTQTIWIETNCNVDLDASMTISWFTLGDGHDKQPATVLKLDAVHYKIISTYKLNNKKDYKVRLFDMSEYDQVFKMFNSGNYFKITRCKIQRGTRSTDETPLQQAKRKSITIKNNRDKGTNSTRLFGTQINNDYVPTVSYFYLPKLEIGHKPTPWTEGGGDLDVTF